MPTLPTDGNEHAELTPEQREARMHEYQLADTHRRIANILTAYAQAEWTLNEAQAVLATLSGIVRVRQGGIQGLRVAVTLNYSAGHVVEHHLCAK